MINKYLIKIVTSCQHFVTPKAKFGNLKMIINYGLKYYKVLYEIVELSAGLLLARSKAGLHVQSTL